MDNIRGLINLSQQLSAVLDDMDLDGIGILNVHVSYDAIDVHMTEYSFMKMFCGFKINRLKTAGYHRFKISKVIQGVTFYAFSRDLKGLKHLKNYHLKKTKNRYKKSLPAMQCE